MVFFLMEMHLIVTSVVTMRISTLCKQTYNHISYAALGRKIILTDALVSLHPHSDHPC